MNPNLRNMVVAVGTVIVGGVALSLYTPQPATRTMGELRDAGITVGQRLVLECPERLTAATKRRINRLQPGALRPSQSYGRVARVAVCLLVDGGTDNCVRPADGGLLVAEGGAEVVVPSLRRDVVGIVEDGGVDEEGEDNEVDDALQFRLDDCRHLSCNQYDTEVDAGRRPNPYAPTSPRFCNGLNRLALVDPPCMIPDGRLPDGGWLDDAPEGVIDCRFGGPYAEADGGPRWRGVNVGPREYAVGSQCLSVECSVVSGDVPSQWL